MRLVSVGILALSALWLAAAHSEPAKDAPTTDYQAAKWDPIHFKPAIETATDEQCLACHQEVLDDKVREASPAGVKSSDALAWYQTLSVYSGEQDTFHRRHLVGPLAEKLMSMKCITCHQGNDPREEVGTGVAIQRDPTLTMRKMVDPNTCLMCHGQFPYQLMTGLTGPWSESGKAFGDNCMTCHAAFRTARHQVNFLKADAIEKEGTANPEACYGCHGARAWYRISYPYPRHSWPGIAKEVPDWAKDRPTESDPRFLVGMDKDQAKAESK